jgi:hypothetical protein
MTPSASGHRERGEEHDRGAAISPGASGHRERGEEQGRRAPISPGASDARERGEEHGRGAATSPSAYEPRERGEEQGRRAPISPGAGEPREGAGEQGAERVPRSERDRVAREALRPLGPDERPPALLVAIGVCALLAVGVFVGAATVHDLNRHGGSLAGGALIAVVLALTAQGMYRRRYWAVLAFEALLAFQIIVSSLALVVASTLTAAGVCVVGVGLGGWLFWKLVRVMGRIQAGDAEQPLP